MAEGTLSNEIKPLFEETAQQLADAIEDANKATQEIYDLLPEFTDNIFRRVEEEMLAKMLTAAERFAKASFLTRWYWKRKVEKSRSAFEETHKAFEEWRGKYANH